MSEKGRQIRLLFVLGSPKSGTTWLQKVLDAHPAIACAGEGHFVERIVTPTVVMMRDYNEKLKHVDELVYQGKAPYQPLTQQEIVQIARELITKLMLRQAPPKGIAWLGDKTPRYTEGLNDLRILFPAARFIFIVRDPRDVAVSRLFHAKRAGYDEALTRGTDTYYEMVTNAATAWAQHNSSVSTFSAKSPAHAAMLHRVGYEALLGDFTTVAAELFRSLDVDNDAATLRSVEDATNFKTLSGRDKGVEDPDSFFRKGMKGDWVERLDDRALDIIRKHCGSLGREFGYDI